MLSVVLSAFELEAGSDFKSQSIDPWSMFRHDPLHSGASTSSAPGSNLTIGGKIWVYETGNEVHSSAAVVSGIVYVGSYDNSLYAINATTGTRLWKFSAGDRIHSSPAVANGMVIVGSYDNRVYAVNQTDGSSIWNFTQATGAIHSSPVVVDDRIFVGSLDKNVYALDMAGNKVWNKTLGSSVSSSPAVANGVVYVGCLDKKVYALNATNGIFITSFLTNGQVISSPSINYGRLFVGSSGSRLYALNQSTLSQIWTYSTTGAVTSSPAVTDGVVFFGSEDTYVYALNATAQTPVLKWSRKTGNKVISSPVVADGKVFVGSNDGRLYALNETTGDIIWTYGTGGSIDSSPSVAEGKLFVGSLDKRVYAFGPNSAPNAAFTFVPSQPIERELVQFNASSSFDPDYGDSILTYWWNFGDGSRTITLTPTTSHGYANFGSYSAALIVTDSHQRNSTVFTQQIQIRKHDMAVTAVQPADSWVHIGEVINVNVTVRNEGNFTESDLVITAYADIDISRLGDEIIIGSDITTDLAPGATSVATIPWNTTDAQRNSYKISANVSIVPYEYNIANNGWPDGFVAVKLHDVAVTNVTAEPTIVLQSEIVQVNATVLNVGDFSENVTVTMYANDVNMTSAPLDGPLLPGENATITFQWNTTGAVPGDYLIKSRATVDVDQNLANNELTDGFVTVKIKGHDVNMLSVVPSQAVVFWPDSVDINVTVLNSGNFNESQIDVVVYSVNTLTGEQELIGSEIIPELTIGNRWVGVFAWSTMGIPREQLPSNYDVAANATLTLATDDNPSNNQYYDGPISVRAAIHDVAVTGVAPYAPFSVVRGTLIDINVTVENMGAYQETNINITAYADADPAVLGDEVVVGYWIIGSLGKSQSVTIVLQWDTNVTLGDYTTSAQAIVPSGDEESSNNWEPSDFTVTVLPPTVHDIAVTAVRPYPLGKTILFQGFPLNITVTVANNGHFAETFVVILNTTRFMSTKQYTLGVQSKALSVGASATLEFQWNGTPPIPPEETYGTAFFQLIAYAIPVPGETNTTNNRHQIGWNLMVVGPGDVNFDSYRIVDIKDLAMVAKGYGAILINDQYLHGLPPQNCCPHDPNLDVNNDGKIDIKDLAIVAKNYGRTY